MFERVKVNVNNPIIAIIAGVNAQGEWPPTQEKDGIVIGCAFNFGNLVDQREWSELYMLSLDKLPVEDFPSFGVVDSIDQFMEKFGKALSDSKYKYAVGFTRVKRADQPESGGWRWHKWGEYFGNHKRQHEYLHDEEGIDEVWTFSILRKREG